MKIPLVSVILPVYNVDKYLAQCLDSIVSQTYDNIEIIVVIDGSPDNSLSIANHYAETDKRIKVVIQKNAGSGPARNNGLSHATGEFIAFVDPDDWIANDYIETLVRLQNSRDYDLVIVGNIKFVFDGAKLVRTCNHSFCQDNSYTTRESTRNRYLSLRFIDKLVDTPWGRLYKKSIIDQYGLRFPELRRSQDIYFNTLYYNHISSLCESTYLGYNYRSFFEERGKIKTDYYLTAEILYNQVTDLYKQWDVEYDRKLVLSVFALNVVAVYEMIIDRGETVEEFENNTFVKFLYSTAHPKKFIHRFELFCLRKHLHFCTRIVIKIKDKIKRTKWIASAQKMT